MLQRKLLEVPVSQLQPNDYNPNRMKPQVFDKLVEDIRRNGILNPLHVYFDGGKYVIIDGEHRYKAAKLLGFEKVMAFVYEGNVEEIKKIMSLRLNVLHGTIDPSALVFSYKDYIEKYGAEGFADLVGFNEQVWENLRNEVVKLITNMGLPKQTVKKISAKVKKANTLDAIVKIVDEVLQKYGTTLTNYGFVSFSDGRGEHIYIELDTETFKRFSALTEKLVEKGIHMREIVIRFIEFSNKYLDNIKLDEEMPF